MITTEQFQHSFCGIEKINEFDTNYGVSIGNRSGATEYNLRFYYFHFDNDEAVRLNSKRGEYELVDVNEDCEVGSVEFCIGKRFHRLDFGHDGDEPFTATYTKIVKPTEWSYEKTLMHCRKEIDEETAKAFIEDRRKYFDHIHDNEQDALKAFHLNFSVFLWDSMKPTLRMS